MRSLGNNLGAKVNISVDGKGRGRIVIPFSSHEDFQRIKNLLEKN